MSERQEKVTRTYLQILSEEELNPSAQPEESLQINQVADCPPSFYRHLYSEVGRSYFWVDRLPWSDEDIGNHLARIEISLWALYCEQSLAGYFELERHNDGSVEIAYFGLLEPYVGRSLGKWLLTRATQEAWKAGANRVWLHTCTLDHNAAMPNYLKRGFKRFKEETYFVTRQNQSQDAD